MQVGNLLEADGDEVGQVGQRVERIERGCQPGFELL